MEKKYFLAIDIGASSGRHIIGWMEDGSIQTDEVYRFKNGVIEKDGHLIWDIDNLEKCVLEGIKYAFNKYSHIESLAIDTWGVDYVLMKNEEKILPVYAYRDSRTENSIDAVHSIISFKELYKKTGIQFQTFNTIYQLYDDKMQNRLDDATSFLMMPEYLTYYLTNIMTHEYTECSTGGLVDPNTKQYDKEIINMLGLKESLFPEILSPGVVVGRLKEEVKEYVGGDLNVILCASHDTGSAVEGIPMEDDEIYLSSGTWSLLGVKLDKAKTDEESMLANYSNEGGVGYIRYLKNIMGMWIVNNLKKELCPDMDFATLIEKAKESTYNLYVDVNKKDFFAPISMVEAFNDNTVDNPKTIGDYFRCAFLSLAHGYKEAIDELSKSVNKRYSKIYIVGGGAKNTFLNELVEEICNIKVVALPIEATALGNLAIQMKGKVK